MIASQSTSVVKLRRATLEDAEICGGICYEAFAAISSQHNFAPEPLAPEAGVGLLGMIFSHLGFYCVVAESEGRVVGSHCLDERSAIPGVGPVTVAPGAQDRSTGRSPNYLVFDGANIWAVSFSDNTITKLRASDGANLGTFNVSLPRMLAFDKANIWAANVLNNTILKDQIRT